MASGAATAALVAAAARAAGGSTQLSHSDIRTTVLDNGLTIVTERMEHVRSVALGYWVGVGSRDEAAEIAGASHFLEHLLFKGTEHRSAQDIAESVDEAGGDLNAFTTREYTAFEVRLLADDTDLGLDVLGEIFWTPALRSEDVDVEREVILEEIMSAADDPTEFVHDLLMAEMFEHDQLGAPILGDDDSIAQLPRDAIAGFHSTHYVPGQVVVAAAGAVDHDHIVRHVAARAGPGGEGRTVGRGHIEPRLGTRTAHDRDGDQAHVVVGYPGLDRASEDRYALELIVHALGGGLSSRLFQEVRERRGLAYNVFASRAAYEHTGLVSLYAATATANVRSLLEVFEAQAAELASTGITERELDVAKGGVRASILLGLEDSGARMARLGRAQLVHGRVPDVDEIVAKFDAVTSDAAARVAAEVFGGAAAVVLLGPDAEPVP